MLGLSLPSRTEGVWSMSARVNSHWVSGAGVNIVEMGKRRRRMGRCLMLGWCWIGRDGPDWLSAPGDLTAILCSDLAKGLAQAPQRRGWKETRGPRSELRTPAQSSELRNAKRKRGERAQKCVRRASSESNEKRKGSEGSGGEARNVRRIMWSCGARRGLVGVLTNTTPRTSRRSQEAFLGQVH